MVDRKKVIKALEVCSSISDGEECPKECPYRGQDMYCIGSAGLMLDALDLLKDQEAEAKWIYGEDKTGVDGWRCSECDFFEPWFYEFTDDIDFIRFYGHCPKCGRRMTSYTGKPTQERR